jgi:two-component system chemotaxis response regulator CheY
VKLLIVGESAALRTRISRLVQVGELAEISQVGLARSAAEALRLARVGEPELVGLDLNLPGMDALACLEQLRELLPDAAILAIGALSDKAMAARALQLGAAGFVGKPYSDEELRDALREAVAARRCDCGSTG